MRALVGAIITAGALIGLGLTAVGIGIRYNNFSERAQDGTLAYLRLKELDSALGICLVATILAALIGLGITYVGLAYHHFRRHHEHLRLQGGSPPGGTSPTSRVIA